jgi:hypothetical protein
MGHNVEWDKMLNGKHRRSKTLIFSNGKNAGWDKTSNGKHRRLKRRY